MSKFGDSAAAPVLDGFDFKMYPPEQACARLAKNHYENFTVGSILLPRELRKHVFNIYAYCRICDDLADETNDREMSLRLLDWWREELHSCYEGSPRQSVFQALAETINQYGLPMQPFEDLIDAFVQDQRVTRYTTFEQLLHYCSRSANPVGRLFLYLLGYTDETRQKLSDYTCSALQLANFWQDIGSDYLRGRIYVPQEDMERFGYTEAELRNHIVNAGFVQLMRFEINRTREFFEHGATLPGMIAGSAATDVELFSDGGLALLQSIERRKFDVFSSRVTVSKSRKAMMMAFWCIKRLGGSLSRG